MTKEKAYFFHAIEKIYQQDTYANLFDNVTFTSNSNLDTTLSYNL